MPTQVTNYQCPACTGPLHFSGALGKLECDYCGKTYEVAEIEALYAEKDAKAAEASAKEEAKEAAQAERQRQEAADPDGETGWSAADAGSEWGDEAEGMKAYNCPSCGAQLICDETTAATSCPYCGNPTVVPGQLDGVKKPDYVIPFRLDKKAAEAALKRHYKGKVFLPKAFTSGNHIQEVKGIYVPFWLFDGQADADVTFHATRSHSHTEGDYRVTTTEHYAIHRAGTVSFEKIPVDASTKMPDDHMDSIEPFDYEELKPFSTAYLPGFLADRYDVSLEDSIPRAEDRASSSAVKYMRDTVKGYETVVTERQNVRIRRGRARYAMFPVWMLNTKWGDKNFLFAMNGQTGKLVGDLPVSRAKFWGLFAAIAVPLGALLGFFLLR